MSMKLGPWGRSNPPQQYNDNVIIMVEKEYLISMVLGLGQNPDTLKFLVTSIKKNKHIKLDQRRVALPSVMKSLIDAIRSIKKGNPHDSLYNPRDSVAEQLKVLGDSLDEVSKYCPEANQNKVVAEASKYAVADWPMD